jgi:hypothetical protein
MPLLSSVRFLPSPVHPSLGSLCSCSALPSSLKGQRSCMFLLGLLLVLSGCVTPYQPKGLTGGYTDFETQPGVYYVSFRGNGYTSRDTVIKYWHQRAAEICGGSDRYEIVSQGAYSAADISGGSLRDSDNIQSQRRGVHSMHEAGDT